MILNIENGESSLSVRNKLNQIISAINILDDGIAKFKQTSTPLLRIDGSPLQTGDTLLDTSDGSRWIRNGNTWLSPIMATPFSSIEGSSAILSREIATQTNHNIFIKQVSWTGRAGSANNTTTNFRQIKLIASFFSGPDIEISTLADSKNTLANQFFAKNIAVNMPLITSAFNSSASSPVADWFIQSAPVGNPQAVSEILQVFFHLSRK